MWFKELKELATNNLILILSFVVSLTILTYLGMSADIMPVLHASFDMVGLVVVTCLIMGMLRSDIFEGYVFMSHHKFVDLLEEWEAEKAADREKPGKNEMHNEADIMRALALKSQGNIQLFAVLLIVLTVLFLSLVWKAS